MKNGESISRKAALDALRAMQTYKLGAGEDMLLIDQAEAMSELMMLPPAEPEIIRCKDCKHASNDKYCLCSNVTWWNRPDDYCSRAERREE